MQSLSKALRYGLTAACILLPPKASAQDLVKQMVRAYRQSVVYLTVSKTTASGAVVMEAGTGFVVSTKGHVMTSCHLVDKAIRDDQGNILPMDVDKVTIQGSTASKAGTREPVTFLSCAQAGIDVALLKFANTAVQRLPVAVSADDVAIGDELAAMGFALNTEFFARPGTISSETDVDTILASMVLNPGDSGAPVFNKKVHVVGIAEAGYEPGSGIGVIRPVRHAVSLLSMAGVNIFAVNAEIPTTPMATSVADLKVFTADPSVALLAFAAGLKRNSIELSKQKVTYPIFRSIDTGSTESTPPLDIHSIPARPGYKITSAKFIVTDSAGLDVIRVSPNGDGSSVRAAFEKSDKASAVIMGGKNPYIKGYIETTQVKMSTGLAQ